MTFKKAVISIIILMAALSRLIPHPANFTPIMAMGIFGGVYFKNKKYAVTVPLLAMMLSDMVIGFHGTMIWVYSSIIIISLSASMLKPKMMHLSFASVGSSLFKQVLVGVAQALERDSGSIEVGNWGDLLTLDSEALNFWNCHGMIMY